MSEEEKMTDLQFTWFVLGIFSTIGLAAILIFINKMRL